MQARSTVQFQFFLGAEFEFEWVFRRFSAISHQFLPIFSQKMTPGITFHRGNKKLKLGKAEINEAIEFPEDFEFCSMEQERRWVFKQISTENC